MKKRFVICWHNPGGVTLYLFATVPINKTDWCEDINDATEYDSLEEAEQELSDYLTTTPPAHFDLYQIIPVYRNIVE